MKSIYKEKRDEKKGIITKRTYPIYVGSYSKTNHICSKPLNIKSNIKVPKYIQNNQYIIEWTVRLIPGLIGPWNDTEL